MVALEKYILKDMTDEIEMEMYKSDFIDDVEDILEDAILGLDEDDIQLEESEITIEEMNSLII